jgi:23S rRNA pseudouridine1911/1915/1917 synthase
VSREPPAEITAARSGQTVAAVVRELQGCSWSRARTLCHKGHVLVDGEVARDPAVRVQQGSVLHVRARGSGTESVTLANLLAVDREVVVVVKPAGIDSVPYDSSARDTLQHRVQAELRRRFGPGPPLRVVQRLDRDTTGVMVFARTRRAERALQSQFRAHTVERRYLALALGEVTPRTHRSHLVADRGDGLRGSANPRCAPDGKLAITHVDVLAVASVDPGHWVGPGPPRVSLVACRLETGRQHQIRIHLAEAGHPLVGERVYVRDHRGGAVLGFEPGHGRPLLHAERLGFVHPADDRMHRWAWPLPMDFADLLERLGVADPTASSPDSGTAKGPR